MYDKTTTPFLTKLAAAIEPLAFEFLSADKPEFEQDIDKQGFDAMVRQRAHDFAEVLLGAAGPQITTSKQQVRGWVPISSQIH